MGQFLRPLAGCDVMRLATFSKFKWNFQRPLAGCDWTARKTYGTTFRLILRPLAGCDYSAEGNILLEDEETLISVPLRGVIADGGYRNIIVLVCV